MYLLVSKPAAYACSSKCGYATLYGAKVRFEELSIIGSLAAYR